MFSFSVEVDCRVIFAAGQLGVALNRARSADGVRVINFSERACIPQTEDIETYLFKESVLLKDDLSCCTHAR